MRQPENTTSNFFLLSSKCFYSEHYFLKKHVKKIQSFTAITTEHLLQSYLSKLMFKVKFVSTIED